MYGFPIMPQLDLLPIAIFVQDIYSFNIEQAHGDDLCK
jgi:hypothetical protein